MDASPTLDSPRPGDPITADWAARVADAANAVPRTPLAPGAFASPFGSVPALAPQPMLGAPTPPPMPFDLRLVYNESTGANEAYVALYEDTVWILRVRSGSDGTIFYPSNRTVQSGSEAKDPATGLARLPGFVDGAHNYFVIWFTRDSWDIVAQQNKTRPSWSNEERIGPFIVGEYCPGAGTAPRGLRQFHRGLIFYNVSWVLGRFGTSTTNYCKSIGDSNGGNVVIDLDGRKLHGAQGWEVDGGLKVTNGPLQIGATALEVGGYTYTPQTIHDRDGNTWTVLAR